MHEMSRDEIAELLSGPHQGIARRAAELVQGMHGQEHAGVALAAGAKTHCGR